MVLDVPLEFVREVARASSVAEAGHVEGRPVARHDGAFFGDVSRMGLLRWEGGGSLRKILVSALCLRVRHLCGPSPCSCEGIRKVRAIGLQDADGGRTRKTKIRTGSREI